MYLKPMIKSLHPIGIIDGRWWAAMVDVTSGDLWFILCSERWCMMMDVTDPTLVRALVAEIGLSPYSMYPRP